MDLNVLLNLSKKEYFVVGCITFGALILFKNFKVPLFIFLTGAITYSFVYINYTKYKKNVSNETLKNKYDNLLIKPDNSLLNYPEIIDYLSSLESYIDYNIKTFKDLVIELNNFFNIYENINYEDNQCSKLFDLLLASKIKILNNQDCFIYSLPDNIDLLNDLTKKRYQLEKILDKYIDNVKNKCNIDLFKKSKPFPKNLLI